MRTNRTALLLCLPCGACVLNQPASTTDVNLETGSETTLISTGDTSSADTSTSGSADTGSSSGPQDTGSESTTAPDPCGNGIVEAGEDCDGEVDKSCTEVGVNYNGGTLSCTADCQFDTSTCERCEAPELKPCDAGNDDPFNALELDCDLIEGKGWDRKNSVSLSARRLDAIDPTSFRVYATYGDTKMWTPRAGERALILTTGSLPPVLAGALKVPPGTMNPGVDNGNINYKGGIPVDYRINPNEGGASPFVDCDGVGDCSNTLINQWDPTMGAIDVFYAEFETVVPAGTHGYELDLAFFTAHYPVYKDNKEYNDVFLLWSQSELYVGNITYLHDGDNFQPMSLPSLVSANLIAYDGAEDPELLGTGFHGKDYPGGATPWLTVAGPAKPGESLTIAVAAFDAHEHWFDSAMILDNFRWRCEGCELDLDCGLRLQQPQNP